MVFNFFRRHEKIGLYLLLVVLGIFGIWGPGNIAAPFSGFQAASFKTHAISSDDMVAESIRCFSSPQDRGGAMEPAAQRMALNRLIYLQALKPSGLGAGEAQAERALEQAHTRAGALPSETWSLFGPAQPRPYQASPEAEQVWRMGQGFGYSFQSRLSAWHAGRLPRRAFEALREVAREEIILKRHRRLLEDTAKTTLPALYEAYARDQARLKVRYALLDVKACEALVPADELSDKAVSDLFEARKNLPASVGGGGYQVPERLSLAYLVVREEKINAQIPVDPAEVESYYLEHKDRWIDKNSHQVLKTLEAARPEIVRELNQGRILNRMDDLCAAILDAPESEPFAKIAERLGIDAGTAEVDAENPVIDGLGRLPDLHDAAAGLEPGARIGRPVPCGTAGADGETNRDQCVLRLLSRSPAHAPDLAEVRERVLSDLKAQKAREMAGTLLRRLKEDSVKDGLEKALADAPKIPGLTTGISPTFRDPDLAALPKPLERQTSAARSAFELQKTMDLTEPSFSQDESEACVLQVLERIPPDPEGFQAQRNALSKRIRENIADQFLGAWLESVNRNTAVNARLGEVLHASRSGD